MAKQHLLIGYICSSKLLFLFCQLQLKKEGRDWDGMTSQGDSWFKLQFKQIILKSEQQLEPLGGSSTETQTICSP